ncbi:hypothetical protein QBC37DRAFT_379782 [Rhypophila decipiens]|uniref:Uncharacterized protein n=1 Tax=Rhypophila decipiens TaxID=261697 RepID=A0AAN6XW23_9PEZI|nr:hypothetical protein QBC37DRAFT_379782 [Rhypophila decipiens]
MHLRQAGRREPRLPLGPKLRGHAQVLCSKDQWQLRDPPNFHAHTFGEHEGYGVVEVIQNLVLDFEDAGAAGNWREQYAICEAIAFFMMTELSYPATAAIDDPVLASRTHALVGRMFLSMLAQLDSNGLLTSTSSILNLGLIMAFYIVAAGFRRASFKILKGSNTEPLRDATDDNRKWCPDRFDDHSFAYAKKRGIKLARIGYVGIVLSSFDMKPLAVVSNPPTTAGSTDPFGFAKELESYKKRYAGLGAKLVKRHHRPAGTWVGIGGDHFDFTTWTSDERKKASYMGRDPMGQRGMDAIAEGKIFRRR